MLYDAFFKKIDNSQIIIFRVFFGIIIMAECWGAILTGWVQETFINPSYTFTFIGFEWTQILLGNTMQSVFIFMGFLGLFITLGAFYRITSFLFALSWSLVYFMQKSHYNNHYYFLLIIAWIMVFTPSHRYFSIDAFLWPKLKSAYCKSWNRLIFIFQMSVVYFFAAIAKIYPAWFDGTFLSLRLNKSAHWYETYLGWSWVRKVILDMNFIKSLAWLGFGFDLLIFPLLLIRQTRIAAFICVLFFHFFNSAIFHVGVFPYFSIVMTLFFFPPDTIQKLFFPKKIKISERNDKVSSSNQYKLFTTYAVVLFMMIQIYLPIRHWFIPGDVFWTEEGHRLAWRMMLRTKSANTSFYVSYVKDGKEHREKVDYFDYLEQHQIGNMMSNPDMMWQFAHYLKKVYAEEKKINPIKVNVNSQLSVNGSDYYDYIDANVDLTATKWNYFGHQTWILPKPKELTLSYPELNWNNE